MGKRRIKICRICKRRFTPRNQKPLEYTKDQNREVRSVNPEAAGTDRDDLPDEPPL
jgi:hypothetical protein